MAIGLYHRRISILELLSLRGFSPLTPKFTSAWQCGQSIPSSVTLPLYFISHALTVLWTEQELAQTERIDADWQRRLVQS